MKPDSNAARQRRRVRWHYRRRVLRHPVRWWRERCAGCGRRRFPDESMILMPGSGTFHDVCHAAQHWRRVAEERMRVIEVVGLVSVVLSIVIGVAVGLLAGFKGGWVDGFLMRVCDVVLSFPAILIALLIAGVGRAMFPNAHNSVAFGVLILSLTFTGWVQYARTVRGSTLVERNKEYVQAARVAGVPSLRIMRRHVLPNVMGPVLVLATIHVATAIITEATLSFLGVGVPPTSPSLGTLIRIGNDYLFSGEWWIAVFPGVMLILIALSVNLLGDWLRDALNPKLQ